MKTLQYTVRILTASFFAVLSCFLLPFPLRAADDDLRLKTVVIDAGHGGHDPGCVSRDGRVKEKTINLDIAKKLGARISEAYPDVKVIYTRTDDVFIPLVERAAIANRNNANLFISIHVNAATTSQAHGYSAHILGKDKFSSNQDLVRRENSVILLEEDYSTNYQGFDPNDPESFIFFNLMQNAYYEQSLTFAADVERELKDGPIKHSRGISQNLFIVLWKTTMPAVLVEVGFMSNAADQKILNTASGRSGIASQLFEAFSAFKKNYDASLDYDSVPSSDVPSAAEPDTVRGFGVQIFVLSKLIQSSDESFKGYDAFPVRSGNVYKYIIPASSADEARKLFDQVKRKFPGAFPVKILDGAVSAL